MVIAVPTLDQVAEHPELVQQLPPHLCTALTLRCAGVLAALSTRMGSMQLDVYAPKDDGDRLIMAHEAATKLGLSKKWVYSHRRSLPFYVEVEGRPRFSEHGLQRFIALKQAAGS